MQFSQPDSIIPSMVHPQYLNRYSYVTNRPINLNDPSGHRPCGDGELYNCNGTINTTTPPGILDSIVVIVFGKPGKGNNTLGLMGGKDNSSQGVGVVVNNKFEIKTAAHVYTDGLNASANLMLVQVNGTWIRYNIGDLDINFGQGDVITITLPNGLPGDIRPAHEAKGYHSQSGQAVVTTYVQPSFKVVNGERILTGYSVHSMQTVMDDPLVTRATGYGNQLVIANDKRVLNEGDSGGGVFYNNQLIAVNSSYFPWDPTKVPVAPLCFENNWITWLVGSTWAYPC